MSEPRVVVLRAAGINCEQETCRAWVLAGARCELMHLNRIIEHPETLDNCDILTIPGGFSYGDDLAAGRIFARRMMHYLADALPAFVDRGRLVLGICNGFQILIEAGLLTGGERERGALTLNASGRFVCRWVNLQAGSEPSAFLEKDRRYFLPIAHAEGRFAVANEDAFDRRRVALRYVNAEGSEPPRPANPNGSFDDVAALTDATGRVLGLMPHPERHVEHTQHPYWTATRESRVPDGLAIFRAALHHFE